MSDFLHERDQLQDPASVSIDFDFYDHPQLCIHCPSWWAERVVDAAGVSVTREWHRPDCPVAIGWFDDRVPVLASERWVGNEPGPGR